MGKNSLNPIGKEAVSLFKLTHNTHTLHIRKNTLNPIGKEAVSLFKLFTKMVLAHKG